MLYIRYYLSLCIILHSTADNNETTVLDDLMGSWFLTLDPWLQSSGCIKYKAKSFRGCTAIRKNDIRFMGVEIVWVLIEAKPYHRFIL